jgi:hypothetical protein
MRQREMDNTGGSSLSQGGMGSRRATVSPHDDPSRSMAGTIIQMEVLG